MGWVCGAVVKFEVEAWEGIFEVDMKGVVFRYVLGFVRMITNS